MGLKLRQIRTQPTVQDGEQGVLLSDPLGIGKKVLFVPGSYALLLTLMDGTREMGTLKTGFELRTGVPLSKTLLESVVAQLDEALLLDNERFAEAHRAALDSYRAAPSRPPALAGQSYPANADDLDRMLQACIRQSAGNAEATGDVKGLISPHIDFQRGGHVYAQVWTRARDALSQADVVVILGTDHNEAEASVTLTRQSYATPWGAIPTAVDVVDEFARVLGEGVFERELNHRVEHSIEMAAVWLHYLRRDRPCPAVPVLCGSFDSFIEQGRRPSDAGNIASTIEFLKGLSKSRRTVIVAAADLAHVGPAFGDPVPLDPVARARLANDDRELLEVMARGKADDFFEHIRQEGDRRRICGLPPIYIALAALPGVTGTLLGYEQCPAAERATSVVSVCAMTLETGPGNPPPDASDS